MLRRKKEGLHVKILVSYMELFTQLSVVLGSTKELNRMILLEFSTREKLSSLGISKFKYLLIPYYMLRGDQK